MSADNMYMRFFSMSPANAGHEAQRVCRVPPSPQGTVPELPDVRSGDARALLTGFLRASPSGGWLPAAAVHDLLDCYQILQVPTVVAAGNRK